MLKILNVYKTVSFINRPLYTTCVFRYEEIKPPKKNAKRKVKETVELITLIGADGNIMGLKPKPDSEKLAKKLNLTLQRIKDSRFGHNHTVYKMVSATDIFSINERDPSLQQKKLKKLPLNSRIADGDLEVKVGTIRKWLEKDCEIHIAVSSSGDTESMRNAILNKLQEQLKDDCRFLNTRYKDGVLKFILMSPKTGKVPPKQKLEEDQ